MGLLHRREWPEPGPEAIEVPDEARWNHNHHYHRVVLDAIPAGAGRALDVGCGEGILTRDLRRRVGHVVGIDVDGPSLDLARQQGPADITYVQGDAVTHPFEPGSFDVIGSVTAIHHMDQDAALTRWAELLAPCGVLAVVGVARRRVLRDLPWDVVGFGLTRWHRYRHRGEWTTPAPKTWPPPLTYLQIRRQAEAVLPGVRFRRHLLWRFSLVWTKPHASSV